MKYLSTSLLLLAVAAAAPLRDMHEQDLSDHTPAAAAFKKTFRTFIGRSDEDVDKFMAKALKSTDELIEAAKVWKRDAHEATDEATAAIATSKRSLHLRKRMAEEDVDSFVTREHARAEQASKHAMKLRREAEEAGALVSSALTSHLERSPDSLSPSDCLDLAVHASKLRRNADAAADKAQEAFAMIAHVVKIRAEDDSIDKVVERDQSAAELATVKETRAKRELYFAEKDMRKRVAFYEKEVKLWAEFPAARQKR